MIVQELIDRLKELPADAKLSVFDPETRRMTNEVYASQFRNLRVYVGNAQLTNHGDEPYP